MNSLQQETQAFSSITTEHVIDSAAPDGHEAKEPEVGNIDKIREIIFGGQMRDYEKRFVLLETRLIRESTELREETRKRFEVLEMFIKREFEVLSDRLQTEQRYREESDRGVLRELHEAAQTLEAKISDVDTSSARAQRELREQILEQSKMLTDEFRQKHDEMSSVLDQQVAGINQDKTGRADLASLFSDLALRLNTDLKLAGDD